MEAYVDDASSTTHCYLIEKQRE